MEGIPHEKLELHGVRAALFRCIDEIASEAHVTVMICADLGDYIAGLAVSNLPTIDFYVRQGISNVISADPA